MKVISIQQLGDWVLVRNLARLTQGKPPIFTEVSEEFKRKMLISRHEPLKAINYVITVECPQWVAMHLVRHKHSLHFVQSSRDDITGETRDPNKIIQYTFIANPVGLMDMSEKRLCGTASEETRELMQLIANEFIIIEPLLGYRLQPSCVVKGYCPEQFKPCGYNQSEEYRFIRGCYLSVSEVNRKEIQNG